MSANVGHGHVHPRPDGVKARCGGPAICGSCAVEQAKARSFVTTDRIAAVLDRWAARWTDKPAHSDAVRVIRAALLDQSSPGERPLAAQGEGADAGKSSSARGGGSGVSAGPAPLHARPDRRSDAVKVWKYELLWADLTGMPVGEFTAPAPAQVVHVGSQGSGFYAWVLVDPVGGTPTQRRVGVAGTGHEVAVGWSHFGSWQDGAFVWHAFLPNDDTEGSGRRL